MAFKRLSISASLLFQHRGEAKELQAAADAATASHLACAHALTAQMKDGLLAAVKQCKALERNAEHERWAQ